ncbi:hypothetical protein V8G54_003342 [Vigna mungo]|uniref:Autophagy-related protein 9 n=1 Tax=Vigna mungo TaxID=3915 RepID=A0AAQ3SCW4_VIGMU
MNELLVLDAEGAMSMVVQHTHYLPKRWCGEESTESVCAEFAILFQEQEGATLLVSAKFNVVSVRNIYLQFEERRFLPSVEKPPQIECDTRGCGKPPQIDCDDSNCGGLKNLWKLLCGGPNTHKTFVAVEDVVHIKERK